ncbi:MAG: site-2 protease family protein [Ardenticatenaceae bacterium]|nr:site-2 protease family protein [Ardenticatenaceae bacterium]
MYQDSRPTTISLTAVESIREAIIPLFATIDTTLDWPEPGHFRLRGHFLRDTADCFDDLRAIFERYGFTPMLRQEDGGLALIGLPHVFNPPASNWVINAVLLIVTIFSTMYVAALGETGDYSLALSNIWLGLPFSISIMVILGAHELGHYFAARHHRVPVTLPYFIPMPFSIIGTMGAFIQLKAPVKNKRALFDVGAAGPLAGLVFAVPLLLYGLATSPVGPLPTTGYMLEGNSILYSLAKILVLGQMLPANGLDVSLNQLAWAGWVGLLVTGLNLIPVGQLDGGHVSYVLFGQRAKQFFWPVIIALALLTVLTGTMMWVFWIFLLFFFGRAYAVPLDDVTPLDSRRRALAIFTLFLFVLVFVPIPFQIVMP